MTSLFLQVTNSAIKPKMASLFRNNKIGEIRFMVQRITKGLTLVALLFVVFFLTLGQWILGFWGTEFQEAYWVLVILSIGQFFNIVTGCSGMLLVMCGHEKIHGYISLVSVILNIILNVILIANYGAFGAAIATTITVILSNISKVIMAKRKTGILTLPRYLNLNAK
jgi:O-antigen/teichoic acid export membrane protein